MGSALRPTSVRLAVSYERAARTEISPPKIPKPLEHIERTRRDQRRRDAAWFRARRVPPSSPDKSSTFPGIQSSFLSFWSEGRLTMLANQKNVLLVVFRKRHRSWRYFEKPQDPFCSSKKGLSTSVISSLAAFRKCTLSS